VLLTQADLTTTRAQAGALMDALCAPFALDQITVQVDASIGVALWPDHCAHPQELLTCAESAMAQAKSMTSHIAVYDAVAQLQTNNDPWLPVCSIRRWPSSVLGVLKGSRSRLR
jgi:diguanylate cyclase